MSRNDFLHPQQNTLTEYQEKLNEIYNRCESLKNQLNKANEEMRLERYMFRKRIDDLYDTCMLLKAYNESDRDRIQNLILSHKQ